MQRREDGGIVISCDFCGRDWDQEAPMLEGHRGSVLCLACLRHAMDNAEEAPADFDCALCLQHCEQGKACWSHPGPEMSPGVNRGAAVCWDCIRLAAKTFHKDKEIDFRWDPAQYPAK